MISNSNSDEKKSEDTEEQEEENFSDYSRTPTPDPDLAVYMSQTVTPAGLVLNPLLEEENFLFPNPVIPGPNFLANTPFLGGLPNPLQLNVFTPPLLGGLLGGGIMMPVAIQLGHNLNPPAALGVGLPTAPMPP
jgi:hypothetical protein